jgi:hypothetical protein
MCTQMFARIWLRQRIAIAQNSREFPLLLYAGHPCLLLFIDRQPNSELFFEVELLKIGEESAAGGGCIVQ